MVGHEKAVTPSDAEMEFIGQRSKAISEHFMRFAVAHDLDMDADTWSADLRAQFDRDAPRTHRRVET